MYKLNKYWTFLVVKTEMVMNSNKIVYILILAVGLNLCDGLNQGKCSEIL